VTETQSEHATTVVVAGDVDLATAPKLQAALVAVDGDVIVDLSEVSFLDSSGLSALIAGRKHAVAAGCGFEVRNPGELVERAMRITGVYDFLNATGSGAGRAADGTGPIGSNGAAPAA